MKILIACEYSGIVREAFKAKGHDALSCDLLPTEIPGYHWEGDIFECLKFHHYKFDLMIAHPPCTYLTVTGARWMYNKDGTINEERHTNQLKALNFVKQLYYSDIAKIAIENPIGMLSTMWEKPTQIIQPYYFGDESQKATCLWLKGLPKLFHSKEVDLFNDVVSHVGKGEMVTTSTGKTFSKWYWETSKGKGIERQKIRSKTFHGIANAMAEQWSN